MTDEELDALIADTNADDSDVDDIDALIASTPAPPSGAEATARGVLQGSTLGFGDEAGGAIGAPLLMLALERIRGKGARLTPKAQAEAAELGIPLAEEPKPLGLTDAYGQVRDAIRGRDKAAQEEYPLAFGAGNVGGAVATAPLLPAVKAIKGASLGDKLLRGALNGMLQGTAYGAGSSEASAPLDIATDASKFMMVGGGLGAAGTAAAEGLGAASKAFGRMAKKAFSKADDMAQKEAQAAVDSARGSLGAKVQQANRLVENLQRLRDAGTATPEQLAQLEALSPQLEVLNRKLMEAGLKDLPGMAGEVEMAKALFKEAQEAAPLAARDAAERILSKGEAGRQLLARVKRYWPVAAGALAGGVADRLGLGISGGLLGAGGGAAMGAYARPMIQALWRMRSHPAVASRLAQGAERFTGGLSEWLGPRASGLTRVLDDDAARLLPFPAVAEEEQTDPALLAQMARANALLRQGVAP